MTRLDVNEAKADLSKYLDRVEGGETIVLCRNDRPIAELRPVASAPKAQRVFGLDKGMYEAGPEFFEPLSEEELRAFEGEGD